MSLYKQYIMNYGDDVTDVEDSPYEKLRMLHDRTELQSYENQLEFDEKVMLAYCDLKLIENAKVMVERIKTVYDFELSKNIPLEQWWWHLDKMVNGEFHFRISANTGVDISI